MPRTPEPLPLGQTVTLTADHLTIEVTWPKNGTDLLKNGYRVNGEVVKVTEEEILRAWLQYVTPRIKARALSTDPTYKAEQEALRIQKRLQENPALRDALKAQGVVVPVAQSEAGEGEG